MTLSAFHSICLFVIYIIRILTQLSSWLSFAVCLTNMLTFTLHNPSVFLYNPRVALLHMMVISFFCAARIAYYLLLYINLTCHRHHFFAASPNTNGETGAAIVKREAAHNMNSLMKGDESVTNSLTLQ